MAGTGAILSLSAIGKQDEYLLSSNVQDSFWAFRTVKHTPFTLFYKSRPLFRNQSPSSNWPFGTTLTFSINPKTAGHLLTNCYLKLTLPKGYYCNQLGNALIKEYSFIVGDNTIQTVPGDWNVIHDELYATDNERYAKRFLINGGNPDGVLPPTTSDIPLYIPLNFLFSRYKSVLPGNWYNNISTGEKTNGADTFKPYFLTCACTQQQIYIKIEMNPITFFSNAATLSLDKVQLVTEEVTLSEEELFYYMKSPHVTIYNTVQRQPVFRLDNGQGVKNSSTGISSGCPNVYKDELMSTMPVKAFHWFIRDQRYENETDNTYYLNRYNFSSNPTANVHTEKNFQILSDARIYINGYSQLSFLDKSNPPFTNTTGSSYYKYVVTDTHGYTAPNRNIYTYSFSLNPKEPSPSGSLDFSVMNSSKDYVNGHILESATSNSYNINTHYIGYIILKYENGFCNLLFM